MNKMFLMQWPVPVKYTSAILVLLLSTTLLYCNLVFFCYCCPLRVFRFFKEFYLRFTICWLMSLKMTPYSMFDDSLLIDSLNIESHYNRCSTLLTSCISCCTENYKNLKTVNNYRDPQLRNCSVFLFE